MVRWVMCCSWYHTRGGIPIGVFGQCLLYCGMIDARIRERYGMAERDAILMF